MQNPENWIFISFAALFVYFSNQMNDISKATKFQPPDTIFFIYSSPGLTMHFTFFVVVVHSSIFFTKLGYQHPSW